MAKSLSIGETILIIRQKEKNVRAKLQNTKFNLLRTCPIGKGCGGKRKQARKIEQKAKVLQRKSTEDGGRLNSIGSKEKKMHNAAKTLEHRIAALGSRSSWKAFAEFVSGK